MVRAWEDDEEDGLGESKKNKIEMRQFNGLRAFFGYEISNYISLLALNLIIMHF